MVILLLIGLVGCGYYCFEDYPTTVRFAPYVDKSESSEIVGYLSSVNDLSISMFHWQYSIERTSKTSWKEFYPAVETGLVEIKGFLKGESFYFNLKALTSDSNGKYTIPVFEGVEPVFKKVDSRKLMVVVPVQYCGPLIPPWATTLTDFSCYSQTSLVVPDNVIAIEAEAFLNCTTLTDITLPATLETLKFDAFSGCTNLMNVVYLGTMAQWEKLTEYDYIPFEISIILPQGCTIQCSDGNIVIL